MTLEELETIRRALWVYYPCPLKEQAEKIIEREIKLKTMDPRKTDTQGNQMYD